MEKNNFNTHTTSDLISEEMLIAEMREISSDVKASPEVLQAVLDKISENTFQSDQKWQTYLSTTYFSRSWRIAVPAVLALILIFVGVLREDRGNVALNVPNTPVNNTVSSDQQILQTASNDDSNQALDQDLSNVDSEMSGLDSDMNNIDSGIADDQIS